MGRGSDDVVDPPAASIWNNLSLAGFRVSQAVGPRCRQVCDDVRMRRGESVVGIDHSPIFVVAQESEAFAVTSADYLQGVRLQQLTDELQQDQHVYLVHLDNPGPGLGVKLTRLT